MTTSSELHNNLAKNPLSTILIEESAGTFLAFAKESPVPLEKDEQEAVEHFLDLVILPAIEQLRIFGIISEEQQVSLSVSNMMDGLKKYHPNEELCDCLRVASCLVKWARWIRDMPWWRKKIYQIAGKYERLMNSSHEFSRIANAIN